MWRAFFLAIGIFACLVGAQCLAIDRAFLADRGTSQGSAKPAVRELKPEEWAPWSFMAGGAVVMLYSFTIPKRVRE